MIREGRENEIHRSYETYGSNAKAKGVCDIHRGNAWDDIEKVYHFDKYDISEYISSAMNDPDKKKKINERKRKWRTTGKQYQRRLRKPWISDESLGGEWGLDASDFGAQAWGGS